MLAYACFLHAEDLLKSTPSEELETVKRIRKDSQAKLGAKASDARNNLPALLSQATSVAISTGSKPVALER